MSSQDVGISNISPANFIQPLKPLSSSVLSYNEVSSQLSPTNSALILATPTTSLQDNSNYNSDVLVDMRLEVKGQVAEKAQSSHVVEFVSKTKTDDDVEIASNRNRELIGYFTASTVEGPGSKVLEDKEYPLSSKVLLKNELCEDLNSTEHTVTDTSPQIHPSSSNSSKVSSPSLSQPTHSLSSTLSSPPDHRYQLKFTTRDKIGDKKETDSDIQMTSDTDQEFEHQSQRKQLRRPLSQRTQVLVPNESDTPVESDSALTMDETPLPIKDNVDPQLSDKVSNPPLIKTNNPLPNNDMPHLPDHTSAVPKTAPKLTLELSTILQGTDEDDVGGVLRDSHPTLHPMVVRGNPQIMVN